MKLSFKSEDETDILRWRKAQSVGRRLFFRQKGSDTRRQLWTSGVKKEQVYLVVWKLSLPNFISTPLIFHRHYPLINPMHFFFKKHIHVIRQGHLDLTEITILVNYWFNTVQATQTYFTAHRKTGSLVTCNQTANHPPSTNFF